MFRPDFEPRGKVFRGEGVLFRPEPGLGCGPCGKCRKDNGLISSPETFVLPRVGVRTGSGVAGGKP